MAISGRCGSWQSEQLKSFELKAATAAGSADDDDDAAPPAHGPSAAFEHGAPAVFMSPRAYAILKERVPPFCQSLLNATQPPSGVTKIKGKGADYVYTDAEAKQLAKDCKELMDLLGQLG